MPDRVDFIWQMMMTTSVLGPRKSSKALPKAKLAPKQGHGHCLVIRCPSDPLQLSESWWNHYIWEVCSTNRWDALKIAKPAASIGQQKGPNSSSQQYLTSHHTTIASKLNELGYKVLPHPPHSPDLSPTYYHSSSISTTFYRESTSTTSKMQKMLSKNLLNPKTWIIMIQE